MYGKVFEDLFCSTLMDYGGDTAYVFIAMIVLSDENGVIKHTAESLARMICKDAESVRAAVRHLEAHDLESNLKAHNGRRIVPLYELSDDETRGWLVVNKAHYRDRGSKYDKKKADRERIAKKRLENRDVATCRNVSRSVADVAHTDTDTDTDTDTKNKEVALRLPEWLPSEEWKAWLEVRKGKKSPNTPRALNLAITELTRLKSLGFDPAKVLDQSTLKGWKSVYPLKPELASVTAEPAAQLCDYCTKHSTGTVNGRRSCDEHFGRAMANERPAKVAA